MAKIKVINLLLPEKKNNFLLRDIPDGHGSMSCVNMFCIIYSYQVPTCTVILCLCVSRGIQSGVSFNQLNLETDRHKITWFVKKLYYKEM